MSEEANSGSDLEPGLNSEEEDMEEEEEEDNDDDDEEEVNETDEEDDENDGDDEEDSADRPGSAKIDNEETQQRATQGTPPPTSPHGSSSSSPHSQPPSQPPSRPSSRPPSRPSSRPTSRPSSRPASPPSSRSSSRPPSASGSQSPSSPESRSGTPTPSEDTKKSASKLSKPAHMRRNIRKLLKEHQLEAVTQAAQQEEMERRRRLEQLRKDFPMAPVPGEPPTSEPTLHQSHTHTVPSVNAAAPPQLTDPLYTSSVLPVEGMSSESLSQNSEAPRPLSAARGEVICLDSSGDEGDVPPPPQPSLPLPILLPKPRDVFLPSLVHPYPSSDVIELSSDEDDALQISSESDDEERSGTPPPDESSGAHANDAHNQPDPQGNVLVNMNHPPEEADLYLAPQLARAVKPHQIGGIRFLYDNLVESVERYKSSSGFGCILAHSMGLGKTLQVISFVDILLRYTGAHTVLTIVPVNTLQNWLAEFNLWLPTQENLPPDTDESYIAPRAFRVFILNDEHKTTVARAKVVEDWSRDGGVLLMGYEMYRLLSLKKSFVTGRKRKTKKPTGPVIIDLDEEDRQQELLKGIEKALSRPGPDVVICDEGHRIKNCHASTSQALKNIRSRRRVVLTGYPLQNNLIEYWCMVDFVRPDFLGTRQEFSNMFERPILNGQCMDSTPQDCRLMRYRSHVLHSLLEGFVQRRGHDVLRNQLPDKEEHVIMVRLCPLQRALYMEFMNRFRDAGNSGWLGLNPLKAFCVCCKIWNHPDVLYETLQKESLANEHDLDLDDVSSPGNARCAAPGLKGKSGDSAQSKGGLPVLGINPIQERANQVVTYEWAKDIMSNYQPGILENSAKMVLLFHLIDESVSRGDKILVFSQSLSTLTVIEDFLSKRPMPASRIKPDSSTQNWVRHINYYRLDGSTSTSERERLINQFNDPTNDMAWVFLLSTRAGCLGVNLIGANRVVVFDASWNPCHDAQAVCRVYRYGQRKPCHIYRLVCDFTLEKKIYDRQVSKQGMSDRVVDDLNPVLNFTRREVESLLHFVEEEPDRHQNILQAQNEMETVIRDTCLNFPECITKPPFQHESLLMDRKEMKLTKAEKRAAKKSYEEEKRASVPYSRPSYAHYYPTSAQNLNNIQAFNQHNWRPTIRSDEKPVASVRPVQSTPIPMMPRQVSLGIPGSSSGINFPVNYLQKADIVIPGANSTTDVQARIGAGESIHVIKGSKGTYIRTNDGRIFAIRSSGKNRPLQAITSMARGSQGGSLHSVSNGGTSSPERKQPSPSPPESPEILRELHRYEETVAMGDELSPPDRGEMSGDNRRQHGQTADAYGWPTPGTDEGDLRGNKRKWFQRPHGGKRSLGASEFPSFPMGGGADGGGMGFPSVGLNPALLGTLGHMNHSLLGGGGGGAGSRSQFGDGLGDLHSMFPPPSSSSGPDALGLEATGNGPLPGSSALASTSAASSSSSSSALPSSSLPPFMLNPSMASMLSGGGFPLSYNQSHFPGSSSSSSASSSTTPGFLSHYPSGTSSLLGAALARPDLPHSSMAENGGSSSDDDVIEVMGQ
ncbi:helicase ARIP4 isoform X3 [Clupea harengus]|uniref:Helicase ARIP4 isoform X3 n=1 Tax=Clupea harengus TaxID=7950 RepID=A0A6P8F6U6_CLUHA|nr:helicase ARIP4 isoform X3 [Clupea harengus]